MTSQDSPSRSPFQGKRTPVAAGIAVVALVLLYILLAPFLERQLGVKLPKPWVDEPVARNEAPTGKASKSETPERAPEPAGASAAGENTKSRENRSKTPPAKTRSEKNAQATGVSKTRDGPGTNGLRDVGRNVMQSPAGLRYGPGSFEGHRVKHVLRHAKDDPQRPIHGVFEGTEKEIFAVIDEAYRLAKESGPRVRVKRESKRTVYTVDLRRRIGYIGGQSGKRSGRPAAKGLRLVLEGVNVITAFPVKP